MSMSAQGYDYVLKGRVMGDSGVGKTCFLLRAMEGTYTGSYIPSIDPEYKSKLFDAGNSRVKLQLWDRTRIQGNDYYGGVHIVFLVYDVTDLESFNNVKGWLDKVDSEGVVKVLIGNKADQDSKKCVDYEVAKEFADKLDIPFYEVSAKTGQGVTKAIEESLGRAMEKENKRNPLSLFTSVPTQPKSPDDYFGTVVQSINTRIVDQYDVEVKNRWFNRGKSPAREESIRKLFDYVSELKGNLHAGRPNKEKCRLVIKKILEIKKEAETDQKKSWLGYFRITHSSLARSLDKVLADAESNFGKEYVNRIKEEYEQEQRPAYRDRL